MIEIDLLELAKKIRLLLLDVDGVLTDGRLYFAEDGIELKAFNILDGHGIKMLQATGVEVGIVTGRQSALVARRAANLGITILLQGREDKFCAVEEILAEKKIALSEVAYVGDDLPDLAAIRNVGLGMTVANAYALVKQHAKYVTQARGGEGAVREVCDFIMRAQNTLEAELEKYV